MNQNKLRRNIIDFRIIAYPFITGSLPAPNRWKSIHNCQKFGDFPNEPKYDPIRFRDTHTLSSRTFLTSDLEKTLLEQNVCLRNF